MTAHIPQAARDAAFAMRGLLHRPEALATLTEAFAKAIADEQERCARKAHDKAQAWARTAGDHNYDRVREAAAYEIEASIRGVTPNG